MCCSVCNVYFGAGFFRIAAEIGDVIARRYGVWRPATAKSCTEMTYTEKVSSNKLRKALPTSFT